MCELLIRTIDKGDGLCFAGDVIVCMPDGHGWGMAEAGPNPHPFWRVVKVPGVPQAVFADMLEPAINGKAVRAFRAKHFAALTERPTLLELNAARRIKAFPGVIG